jgi:hypothetical protein
MREFVTNLITEKKELFKNHSKEMIAAYDRELKTISGYNGRQLLELLQNCDDEESKVVFINLDTTNQTISISNNGTPFSKEGYESLFTSDYSSKVSKKYIGNKGLGFRSIINWSNSIEIHSNEISLTYTEENRKAVFDELFKQEEQKQFIKTRNLKKGIIPMPFLSMPIIGEAIENGYVTTIIIHYKESEFENIQKQIDNITTETFLFLRNIGEIIFEGFENKENINCTREAINQKSTDFTPKEKITFKDNIWFIFEEEKELPIELSESDKDEREFYQIKIAIEENLKQTSPYLYSFFPTNIKLNQPYVLHATFDLDATRNQVNNTRKNKFILAKIVDFTIEVAKYYTNDIVSYKPLEILNHKHRADTLDNLGYYDLVKEAIQTIDIFPCVDNSYKKLAEVVYIGDDFAIMLNRIKANNIISSHLLPLSNNQLSDFGIENEIDKSLDAFENYVDIINNVSTLKLSAYERALFVSQIVKECQFLKNNPDEKVNLLVNEAGNIIQSDEYIYTPITKNSDLKIPGFTKIQFINKNLYNSLIGLFKFDPKENPNKSRFFYDQLKGFCNIHSYEPTTLALKIISETNNVIKVAPSRAFEFVKEMNSCLYFNYKKIDDDSKKSPIQAKVPTISKSKKIKTTEEVSLSKDYPTGKKTTLIFEKIFDKNNYLGSPKENGIDGFYDIQEVENYFLWIGVNKFVKYNKDNTRDIDGYFNYVLNTKNINDSTGKALSFKSIQNFDDILSKLEIHKLILWIYYDEELKKQINDSLNDDIINNFYRYSYPINDKPSYIKYIINSKYSIDFKNLLIDERYPWVNDINIDYRSKEFLENGLSKTNINEILVLLGAKDDFNNISISKVADIINKIAIQFPDGKKSQSFYKKALNHYKVNGKTLRKPLNLFADNGSVLKLYPQKEVYFNDKIKLPKRLKQDFPIFNFPVRAGGVEAIKFFGINDLKVIQVEIISHKPIEEISTHFNQYLDKLKPLILTHRINVTEDNKQRKIQASICNKIKIILCSEIKYKVQNYEYNVSDYEFLHHSDDTYYIKIKDYDSLNSLRKNFNFIESFSDILSLSFDISGEKNEFKYIIKDDFEYVLQNVKNDFGDDTLQESRELLGLADYKHAFWQAVFEVKDFQYFGQIDDLSLEKIISEKLGIDFNLSDIDYENINDDVQLRKVETLFESLGIELEAFSNKFSYKISMQKIHFSFIKNSLLSKKKIIKSTIWKRLSNQDVESQASFLNEINKFENFEDFAMKYSLENELKFKLNPIAVFQEYVHSIYGEIKFFEEINIDNYKSQNLKIFNDAQKFEISQNERYKSLIYFKTAIETLKNELDKDELDGKQSLEIDKENNNTELSDLIDPIIIDSDKLKPKNNSNKAKVKNKGVYTPKSKDEKKLKEIGNSSEKFVYDFLLNCPDYKDVYLASEDNEGLHYDIRYTDSKDTVKYVEVKTFDNNYFHLSRPEYDFGQENKEDYEIWLVNDKKNIIPIKDFFTNDKYKVISNEFLVYLEILKN